MVVQLQRIFCLDDKAEDVVSGLGYMTLEEDDE